MFTGPQESWRPPLFKIGNIPINLVGLIVLLQVAGMLINVISGGKIAEYAVFYWEAFGPGFQLWRIATYPFFGWPDFFWALGLFFFYSYGRFVEESLTRPVFLRLCLSLLLLAPLVCILFHFIPGLKNHEPALVSAFAPHFAIFFSFCAMAPNVPTLLLNIRMKWLGLILFFLNSLSLVGERQWGLLCVLFACTGYAVWFVRQQGFTEPFGFTQEVGVSPPSFPKRSKAKKKPRRKRQERKLKPRTKIDTVSSSEVDRILDKINDHGFHSLTPDEKKTLERSSQK